MDLFNLTIKNTRKTPFGSWKIIKNACLSYTDIYLFICYNFCLSYIHHFKLKQICR